MWHSVGETTVARLAEMNMAAVFIQYSDAYHHVFCFAFFVAELLDLAHMHCYDHTQTHWHCVASCEVGLVLAHKVITL
jgi:hypothetical protein